MNYLLLAIVKITGIPICLALFKLPRIVGKKPDLAGANIIVSNHRSMLDPVLLCYCLPFKTLRVLSSSHLFEMSWWFDKLLQGIGAVRSNRDVSDIGSMSSLADLLGKGHTVIVFPEARRSLTGGLLPFKMGAAYLSVMTGAPVTPVFIDGAPYSLFRKRPTVAFGEKIHLRDEWGNNIPGRRDLERMTEL
jgi:1-acyl-sn-glycerol-3-phosphate acyltransferase